MLKKSFIWLLVLCMALVVVPFTALASETTDASAMEVATGNVAKVGNTEYATIDEAIANWTNNTTLTLLSDVTLSDVVTLKSTEHHILNLGTYTMTAAEGKNAFVIQACGTGSSERSAITINADATNPGGINAGTKCIVYYKYADGGISTEDRPIIKINGGVFTGSTSLGTAGIYTIGTAARKCATVNIAGGTFNCSIVGSTKSKLIVSGGLFNYTVSSQGDSTCSRLISGGTFKTLGFMTADSNNTKFWIGTSMGNSNVGTYVDDNGYIVIGGPVINEAGDAFEASSANYSGASSYLQYSSAKNNGLYYTSVKEALADNNTTSGSVTVYVDELDMTGISYKGTIVVPAESTLTITNAPETLVVKDTEGNVLTANDNGSYTTVVPAGNDFNGYTRGDAIWGEVWGNASTSFVIKVLDKNGNVMGTTSLNNVGGIIDGDVNVTWNLKLDAASNTDEYWTMEWTTAPTIDNMPAKVELWVDGVKVSGGNVVLNGPDEIAKIYAAVAGADGTIKAYCTSLQAAIDAVADNGIVALLRDTTVSGQLINQWYEGIYYEGDKSFTIDLGGHKLSNNSTVTDYLILIKNVGSKANEITFKDGTIEATSTAYCAICTSSGSTQQITVNLENIDVIGQNSNGSVIKIRGGAELNVKAGTVITGENSYLAIECVAATVNIYEDAEIYMNGTTSYNGCLVGVCNDGTVNVYGGYGVGVKGGFIAMTSGGTINVSGGEWIANTNGTVASDNHAVLIAQSVSGAQSTVNVTGGIFKGGYNCYGDAVGDSELNISGGNFNANPIAYVAEGYEVVANDDGTYGVEKPMPTVNGAVVVITDNGNGVYDITLATGTFPADGVDMTFPAKGDASGMAYVVHEHNGKYYIYVGKVSADGNLAFKNTVGFSTFAVNNGGLAEALNAAKSLTGDVTVEIYDKVTLNQSLSGSFSSITFVGKDTDAEIYLDVQGYITATGKTVAFENLILSKSEGSFIANAGFMNVAFGVYDVAKVTYTNCTFTNGAYASSGEVIFNGCTFKRSHDKYGLWAYGDVDVVVDGCTFDDYRGIKMYAEGAAKTVNLTVKNTNFSALTGKPAIVLTYGESVTLEGNTYSATGVFELDLDGAPNGVPVTSTDKITCVNDNGVCGVLVDGKIYTTVAQAAEVATAGSTVTLLHNSTETVEFVKGVTLEKNGYTADGVTVALLGGTGTAEDPYTISSLEALEWFRNDVNAGNSYDNKYVKLTADIDLASIDWAPIGTGSNPFYGMFDGQNHVISNLTINGNKTYVNGGNNDNYKGLFGFMKGGNNAGIKNITVENAKVTGCLYVGAILGRSYTGGIIENCHVKGLIQIDSYAYAGGVVGRHEYSADANQVSIKDCSVDGMALVRSTSFINADYAVSYVGGIVGFLAEGKYIVENCSVANVAISGVYGVGGISGIGHYGNEIADASVSGVTVTSTNNDKESNRTGNVGLIVGATQGTAGSPTIITGSNVENTTASATYTDNTTAEIKSIYGTSMSGTHPVTNYVAEINGIKYLTLADAIAAAQAGDEIILLADINSDIQVPAGVILNGNGKQVGVITAMGDITFKGHIKAANFGVEYVNTTINIGEGACLEITGTDRLVIGHGCIFNIVGTIADAKTANVADLTPSLIMPGASFTGAGVTFNVTNAYIKAPSSYCSSSKYASSTFDFNITNSIWESAGKLAFEAQSTAATVNFELKDSVLTTGSHLVFGVSRGEIVIDNSNVNVGTSRQIENQSTLIIKNGSVVNGAVATSSNAKNPGTIIVDNATYAVTGEFSGSDLGTGTIIVKNGATFSAGSITKANIQVDATGMQAGDEINITANLTNLAGTIEVINNDGLVAEIVDGKIVLVVKPVAQIGETTYTTLEEAFKAATDGCVIEILADVVIDYAWDCRDYATNGSHSQFKESVTINGNGHTIKFTGTVNDNNWNTIFRFEENATVNNLTIDISEATGVQRVITAKKSLTVDRLTIIGSAKYGIIFGEGSSADDFAAAEIVIKNSTLTGTRRAISDNEGGKDVKSVTITGNTLNANVYASASENIIFNNNTAAGEVDLRSYTAANVLAVEAKDNTLNTAVKNYIKAKTVVAQEEFFVAIFYVSNKAELDAALAAAKDGATIILTADIDYGTAQLAITKAITLDLGGKTLTTRNAWGGMSIKNNPTVKNGTIVHASNTAAIKVWNATAFEDLVIDVQGKGDANKTIGGIVLQEGSTTRVGLIKNVTIKGAALTNGIETYNCGDATENVIGSMENVTIDANGTGMLISAPCGTATNCTISGDINAIEISIKGTYSASLDLVDCDVEGGIFAHDEFSSNPDIVNNGSLNLTVDAATTGADDVTLTLARAENVDGLLKDIKDNAQAKVNDTYYASLADAVKAAQSGDTITLLANVAIAEAIVLPSNMTLTIDGNGKKITPASGFVAGGHSAALVLSGNDSAYNANNNYTIKNLTFEGFSGLSRVLRANFCNATIEECRFIENTVSSGVITSAYAALNLVGCDFIGNTTEFAVINLGFDVSNGTDLVANITDCSFIDNNAAIAVTYLASSANVIGNYFKGNIHTGDNANAAAVLAGPYSGNGLAYNITITGNAFDSAMSKNDVALPAVFAEKWASANTTFDLNSNYWDGAMPINGVAYLTGGDQANTNFINIVDYYKSFSLNAEGVLTLADLEKMPSGAVAYRGYIEGSADREAIKVDLQNVYASNSVVVKLYDADGNLLITTTLKAGGYKGDWLTTNIVLSGTASGSWDTVINAEKLTVANVPETAEIWADGILVDTYTNFFGTGTGVDELPKYKALDCVYKAAKIGDTYYASLADAIAAAQDGDTITVIADISDEAVTVDKNVTITGSATLNNVSISGSTGIELVVSGLTFKGNSWINSNGAASLTVSGVTANVTPNNTAATNSRSAFIALGRSEQAELALTVENCNIVVSGGGDPILGWASITEANIIGNTFGSEDAYQNNSDSVKFMAIADGAVFTIKNNTVYSNYNGFVFAQNTTRDNAYTVLLEGNTFKGSADHVWVEVSGANTVHATINASGSNTVNGNAFTKADIKVHPNVTTWTSYAGVDVVTNAEGKVIGGSLAYYAKDVIASGYIVDENGNVKPYISANGYVAQDTHVNGWTTIWGQISINGTESFYVEIYDANGNLLGTTALVDTEKVILCGEKRDVTWHAFLDGSDSWWNTEWTVAPYCNVVPASVKYFVDGEEIGGGVVKMSSPDDLKPVVWAELRGVGGAAKIGDMKYATLADAIAAAKDGDTIEILAGTLSEGTIKLPATLNNVTFKGAADHATILKDMTIMAADGNSFSYIGLTFDGIVFDNSRISITGWRTGGAVVKNLTVTNCVFKNLDDTTNSAPVHINMDAKEAVENFTFKNNVIDGAAGGSKSGVYAQCTGNIVFSDNVINNVSFRPYVVQITTDDGIADSFVVTGNTFSGSAAGRAQGLGNNSEGTDSVNIVVSGNIFKGITSAQQICYWNFNSETTTADLSGNYYDVDILANPNLIYYNSAAQNAADLSDKGVFPYYTELNADGTINTESAVELPSIMVTYPVGNPVYPEGKIEYYDDMLKAVPYTTNCPRLEGATITLLKDTSGVGMRFMENGMIFDLNGFTYTITAGTGSQGTNTSGFQIRPEVTTSVLFKNGTIKVAEGAPVAWMFNNYATGFVLENVTVDCANMDWSYGESCYVAVSRVGDDIQLIGNTKIENFNSAVAGDAYSIGGTMTVGENVVLGGTIQLDAGATLTGPEGLDIVAPDGYKVVYENGQYKVVAKVYVAEVDGVKFESLAEAITAAQADDVIVLLGAINENVTVNKSLTIDGANNQYTGKIIVSGKVNVTIQNVAFENGYIEHNGIDSQGNLTVSGCSFANGGYAVTTARIKSVTIENCTVTNQSLLYAKLSTPNVTVKNVTVTGGNYVAHLVYGSEAYFENVTAVAMAAYGIFTQNYGAKTITIKNCSFDTPYDSIAIREDRTSAIDTFVFEGTNVMTSLENVDKASYVLGTANATLKAPEGLTVTTTLEGYAVKYVDGVYKVVEMVASVNGVIYGSLQEAIDAAQNGETVLLLKDIDIADVEVGILGGEYNTLFRVTGKTLTIDMNGKTISGAYAGAKMLVGVFSTEENGHLTLTGNGTVDITATTTVYALLVNFDETSTMTVENGTYKLDKASDSLVYSGSDETVTIEDGFFTLGNVGTGVNESPWIFNAKGQNTANIIVNGGTYNADIFHQYYPFEVLENEYLALRNNGNGTWTVVPATVCVYSNEDGYLHAVGYETLAEALAAAQNGDIITLLADVALSEAIVVAAGQNFVLDLAGHTISMEDASNAGACAIRNNGTLTIKDSVGNGKITFNSTTPSANFGYSTSTIFNAGVLTVDGGAIENTTVGGASYAIDNTWYTQDVSLTVNGGEISATKIAVRQVPFSTTYKNVVTINGGTLTGATAGLQTHNYQSAAALAEVNIHGGILNGTYAYYTFYTNATTATATTINIDGGTFNGYLYLYNGQAGSGEYPMNVAITGGTFNDGVYVYTKDADGNEVNIPSIAGGTFAYPVEYALCKDGYIPTENGDGTYGVKVGSYVARNTTTGVGYETLADAIAAAQDGETITLLADVTLDGVITIEKAITLDLSGKTVTGADGAIVFNVKADTTIMNGTILGNKSGTTSGLIDIYANLTLDGVTVETSMINALRFKVGDLTATLTNCNVTGAFKGYGASVWNIVSGTYKASSTAINDQLNGTASISGGTFHYAIDATECAPGYVVVDNGDGTYGVKYAPVAFVDANNNGVLDDGEVVYGSLEAIFDTYQNGDVYIVLIGDAVVATQVDTDADAKYYLNTNVAEGVTVEFAFADDWNYVQKMYVGENVTIKAPYLLAWTELEVYGTIITDYLYITTADVLIAEGAVVTANTGDATVQVKNGATLTVNGELNTAILNVWAGESKLVVNGANAKVNASWIDIWDGTPAVSVENGAMLDVDSIKASRGGSIAVDNATLDADKVELGHNGESTGKLTVTNGTVTGEVKLTVVGSELAGPEGMNVTTDIADHKVVYENGVYKVVAKIYVAEVGGVKYESLAEALAVAQDGEIIALIWNEGDAPIAMNGSVFGKTVTITGTATVDWSKGFLFIGRGGAGNGTVIFENANLTSASDSASTGIHVSGREKDTDNKFDGTLIINNSVIELDYLINKGTMTLDNSTLTVKNGFSIGGRPAIETESGEDATATITLNNGSKLVVNNHNGMGLGYEAIGVMNVNSGSTFECTQSFLVTAKGTMNVNGGTVKVAGTLTNNGTITLASIDAKLYANEGVNVLSNVDGYFVKYTDGAYALARAVAEVNGVKYESFEEALAAAPAGSTVKLMNDTSVSSYVILDALTLDLNGYTLTVPSAFGVVALENASIVDNGETKGLLVAGKNRLVLSQATYPMLPVWNEAETGYVFVNVKMQAMLEATGDDKFVVTYRPSVKGGGIENADLFANGAADNGLTFKINVLCMKNGAIAETLGFVLSEEILAEVYGSSTKAFKLGIVGASDIFDEYQIEFIIESTSGVSYSHTHTETFKPVQTAE